MHIDMIDLKRSALPLCSAKNPKWEDFHISDMPEREQEPLTAEKIARTMKIQRVHQMARAISRARKRAGDTFPKPEIKVCSIEEMPKELYDKFFKNAQQNEGLNH